LASPNIAKLEMLTMLVKNVNAFKHLESWEIAKSEN
jgi:hypothetical protein